MSEGYNNDNPVTNGEFALLAKAAPHWRRVIDVGANVGDWAEVVRASSPECMVMCYEPGEVAYEALRQRFRDDHRVILRPNAVGATDCSSEFHEATETGMSGMFQRTVPGLVYQPPRYVRVVSLDNEGFDSVDFVKIDTEGSEMAVLRGARNKLRDGRISEVQIEYGGTWQDARESLLDAERLFEELGWSMFLIVPNGVRKVQVEESYQYSNWLAVRDLGLLKKWGVEVV